jgi:hypothetical protein
MDVRGHKLPGQVLVNCAGGGLCETGKKQGSRAMTHTLHKRLLKSTSPPNIHRLDRRSSRSGDRNDPAALARTLRVLAIRAHHTLKIAQDRVDESIRAELHELRTAICSLEDQFRTQQLDRMLPYVLSLRSRVESVLD